jgi:4-aminobutyrate aminotransferase-like enzyme
MRALRALCDEHGILLIADEVQSGFARTGRFFAMEHYDVRADLITTAKSIGGGLPLSGVVGRAGVMDAPPPGGLGGTYGGNPVACAAALAVIEVIRSENILARATQMGAQFRAHMQALAASRNWASARSAAWARWWPSNWCGPARASRTPIARRRSPRVPPNWACCC